MRDLFRRAAIGLITTVLVVTPALLFGWNYKGVLGLAGVLGVLKLAEWWKFGNVRW